MRTLVLFLALVSGVSAVRATTYVTGDGIGLSPGAAQPDPIVIGERGVLNLLAPGTYTAASWSVSGGIRLASPGNYIVVSSAGSIALNGTAKILGPAGATGVVAQLTFAHSGEFIMSTPQIDPTVDMRRNVAPPSDSPPLVNISTRVTLAAGQTHTSGFVIGGASHRVLIRAVGPSLGMFGITNALATPVLTVRNQQGVIRTNSAWNEEPGLILQMVQVGAFLLPNGSRDAATFLRLDPGAYTVEVNGGAGEVLLEIYYVD